LKKFESFPNTEYVLMVEMTWTNQSLTWVYDHVTITPLTHSLIT